MFLFEILKELMKKKTYKGNDINKTFLQRCLTTLDLTALGIGATLGAGVYVVTGQVAKESSGPAVIISFLIAAIASIMAGLCYAEFGARVPRTGSAYIYSYVAVGELMAFIIGWNLILEYVIGTASVAKAWSANLDEVTGRHLQTFFNSTMSMNFPGLADYADLFAFFITMALAVLLSIGVKESTRFNNVFTVLNVGVVTFTIVCGLWFVDIANWNVPPVFRNDTNGTLFYDPAIGYGYFTPFGIPGILSGAGTCFYAFVGFDSISTTSEEVINPQKAIPIAIITCLTTCFFAYAGISAVLTLMCPYYLINTGAPLPFVFDRVGWCVAKYIVGFGAVFGLSTSLLGAMFPLPRIIYAMASDGLLFRFLMHINPRFKTPLLATLLSGLLAASMAAVLDLKSLVDMMSIGTLLAYTLVAFSVLILRGSKDSVEGLTENEDTIKYNPVDDVKFSARQYLRYIFCKHHPTPNNLTDFICKFHTYFMFAVILVLNVVLVQDNLIRCPSLMAMASFLGLVLLLLCVSLCIQPDNPTPISFTVPGVPWLPAVSMLINIHLMMKLPINTWYRFAVWMTIGFVIYFSYGLWHSEERKKRRKRDIDIEVQDLQMNQDHCE